MRVLGVDFTSRPTRGRPLTCARCVLREGRLEVEEVLAWPSYAGFEDALRLPGPWIAGIDFPFGQPRKFIGNVGWPPSWPGYVLHAASLGCDGFRAALDRYRAGRPAGDKEHRRRTDAAAGAISPQKLYGVPVGLMFFEGARRLVEAGVAIPHLLEGDGGRVVVEAYPGVTARRSKRGRNARRAARSRRTSRARGAARRTGSRSGRRRTWPTTRAATGSTRSSARSRPPGRGRGGTTGSGRRRAPAGVDALEGWICDPRLR